ncbi:MAG: hypothetical protein WC670_08590 [Pseudolabrys sp.]|jgi:tetratricopeptide (TPR) repeat protein
MTRTGLFASAVAVSLWFAVAPAAATNLLAEINDPGAGFVPAQIGPCLIANKTHKGPPCPEPQAKTDGNNAARVANRLDRAGWFIVMQDFAKARDEADLAIGIDGLSVPARLLRARLSMTLNDTVAAERDLAILRKQAPDNPDVMATAATLLLTKPADLEALREFHQIIVAHPDHLYSREQRARLALKMGRADAALADLNIILDARPGDSIARDLRAQAMQALGRDVAAVADIKAAQAEEPENFLRTVERADAYAKAERDELAVKDYDKVLTILDGGAPLYAMPDNMRAKLLVKRAYVLVHMRRFDRAAEDVVMAARVGGVPAALRAQIKLRRAGFADVPLDGKDSPELRKGLIACFGQNTCFQGVMKAI